MNFIIVLKRFLLENYIEDSENFEDLTIPKINCINGFIPDNSTICICNEGYTTSLEIKINEDGSINKCDISISESNINNNNEIVEKKSNKTFLSFILSKILPVFIIAMIIIWFIIKIYLKCKNKNKKKKEKNSENNKNISKKNKNNNNNKHINKRNKKNINFDDIESTTSRNYINNSNNNLTKKNFKQNYNNYNQKKFYYDDNFYNNNNNNKNNKKILYFNENDYINYIKKTNSKTPDKKINNLNKNYPQNNSFQSKKVNKKYTNNIKSIK